MRVVLPLLALLAAVAATGAPIDPAAWDQGGDVAYRRALQPAMQERKLNADRPLTSRVRSIANRVLIGAPAIDPEASKLSWTVNVVTDPVPDVLDYPGGRLLATSGLVVQSGLSDEEIGAIVAHVIAHGLLGHDRSRVAAAVAPADAGAADPNQRALAVARAVDARLKRSPEPAEIAAADRASVEMLARAAYDPRRAASAWKRLAATRTPLVDRYPVDEGRLAALDAAAERAVPLFEDTRAKAEAQQRMARPPRATLPLAR